jgi:Flp pilus assembly protein TadD
VRLNHYYVYLGARAAAVPRSRPLRSAGIMLAFTAVVTVLLVQLLSTPPAFCQSAEMHFQQAVQRQFAGDTAGAIAQYRKGLALQPTNADARARLGVVLLEQSGDIDGALSELITALSLDPECSFCQRALDGAVERMNLKATDSIGVGNDFYRTGDLNRAAAAYRVAVHLNNGDADAHNSLAWTLYRLGRLSEARREVDTALTLKKDEPEYVNTLACILFDQGNLEGALATWQKSITLSKKPNPADLYGLAVGSLSKGDKALAAKHFKEAIKIDAGYAEAAYLRDRIGLSAHTLAAHDQLLKLVEEKK